MGVHISAGGPRREGFFGVRGRGGVQTPTVGASRLEKREEKPVPPTCGATLNVGQRRALDALASGRNVFLSGSAGTGKSYVLRVYLAQAKERGLNVVVCAPTGIAALNVGGTTIHKAFRAKIGPYLNSSATVRVTEVVKSADVVVIDEISMCRIDLFQFIGRVIQRENGRRADEGKRGPIQLIVVGDFFQLPPVLPDSEKPALESVYGVGAKYAFQAPAWEQFEFAPAVLDQVVRQADGEFVDHLNLLRAGVVDGCEWFENNTSPVPQERAVYLCPRKKEVARVSGEKLDALKGDPVTFAARITGKVADGECPADKELVLKTGAQVIMLNNDAENRWVNGTIAEVARLSPSYLYVKLPDESIVEVARHKWDIEEYEVGQAAGRLNKVVAGSFEQYPVRLAYAITIHKSQGQTFDCANIDPNAFDAGMLYVALSRVKTPQGIHLLEPIYEDSVKVDPVVVEFYREVTAPQGANCSNEEQSAEGHCD